jgi:Glyoxalase-like domain
MYLRLRQVCFVARDLAALRDDLVEVFDLSPCNSDPHAASFGLENMLLPIGTSFLEIVSPIQEGTTAGRYLDKRNGDGGYMAIFDSDEIDRWRARIAANGVREASFLEYEGFNALQMHPRDMGGPLLEINHTADGASLSGNYFPAGGRWRHHVRTFRVQRLLGVEIQSSTPEALARRWASILMLDDPIPRDAGWHVAVDNALLRFVKDDDGRGEGLGGIDVATNDPVAVHAAAQRRGLRSQGDHILIGGVRCYLRKLPDL